LDDLRREFLVEAQEKVSEIETIMEDSSSTSLDRLNYLAHQLKGSGGSYGFENISNDAAELEKAVEQQAGDDPPRDDITERIRLHVTNLRSEIERRTRELAT
jgi:HPt (histidine-containing phosphotransfer) domain-containing protein